MADESWTINYLPADGGRVTGILTVSDDGVAFKALYDSSNATILKNIAGAVGSLALTGGHLAYVRDSDAELELMLPKDGINDVKARKKWMMKQVVLTMEDGSDFVFDYGMLSVDKLVKAIRQVCSEG